MSKDDWDPEHVIGLVVAVGVILLFITIVVCVTISEITVGSKM